MNRFLRSKHLRALLWQASDGRCQQCGVALGEGWHADHINPWAVTHDTNVHDMQALCASCNLKKGARILSMKLRTHQQELSQFCEAVVRGERELPNHILCEVVPGGGKSLHPIILAQKFIAAGIIDKICWVVPRQSLQEQAARNFLDTKTLLGHRYELRESTNEYDPTRGAIGYVTTYQALQQDASGSNADEFRRHRYGLILDEVHHCNENGGYHKAVQPLYERAHVRLLLTGTIERGDKKPIAFLPYDMQSPKRGTVATTSPDLYYIGYPIDVALREQAIIHMDFTLCDGQAEWIDRDGLRQMADRLEDNTDAIYAALNTEYAEKLLGRCVEHWQYHRHDNPRAQLLVVCANIRHAKRMAEYLRAHDVKNEIATSDDDAKAKRHIKDFREGQVKALVTVAMAYEGLDVPAVTHIACLTHIRSKPWIWQMFARAWRFDTKAGLAHDQQRAYSYVPDDPAMRECIKEIRELQNKAIFADDHPRDPKEPKDPKEPIADIIPLTSNLTAVRARDIMGGEMSVEQVQYWEAYAQTIPFLRGRSPIEIKDFWEKMAAHHAQATPPEATPSAPLAGLSMKERERRIKETIDKHIRLYEWQRQAAWGSTNKELLHKGFKKREEMTEQELITLRAYIVAHYPLAEQEQTL